MQTPKVDVPETIKRPLAACRTTNCAKVECAYLQRTEEIPGIERHNDFRYPKHILTEREALEESQRCLKCVDAPCQKGCPSQVDVRSLTGCLAEGNIYGAAKVLFTHNPLGWTCGLLCPTMHVCRGACTLANSALGPININMLQTFVGESFAHMNLPQIRNPAIPDTPNFNAKIALIGAGPASLSCATYLARIGYKNLTIFEKQSYPGGIPAIEIPQFRIPYHVSRFEAKLVEDLGVKFAYGKTLGKDFTIASLKEEGYDAIFVGVGYPEATNVRCFREAEKANGGKLANVWNSKEFLTMVNAASKPGLVAGQAPPALPKLNGNVLVVGAGDVASDCCLTAWRCGAKKVTMVFRKGFVDMRCNEDEAEGLRREKVEMIPCASPKSLKVVDGRCVALEAEVHNKDPITGQYAQDKGQLRLIDCDYIITAFGSQIGDTKIFDPVTVDQKTWSLTCNRDTMQTNVEGIYTGGDCSGSASIIQAVNDGKVASWQMHRFLASKHKIAVPPVFTEVPAFMTPVDLVDTSISVAPFKFVNPFGLASGPNVENAVMIKKAFQRGWGWAVTKTFQADVDMAPNVMPRIVGNARANEYLNIELNSERKASYWEQELPKLKKDFPDRVLIASVHCKGTPQDWQAICQRIAATGVDGLQLNFACPNLGERAAGSFEDTLRETVRAVGTVVRCPLLVKLGPHMGDIVSLARACKEGGAWGLAGINTMPGIYRVRADGSVWPSVGAQGKQKWVPGGVSGSPIRPFALKAVADVSSALPGFPFLACGGIDSAASAIQFLQVGAPAVQICSATMYKGFDMIHELLLGLKWHLYAQGRPDLRAWDAQYPPQLRGLRAKAPLFGPNEQARRKVDMEDIAKQPLPLPSTVADLAALDTHGSLQGAPAHVQDIVGVALKTLGTFPELDVTHRTVSLVNTDLCIGCARCQLVCMESGYASIMFDRVTRKAKVTPNCKGCGLCVAACPVGAISTVPAPPKAAPAPAK